MIDRHVDTKPWFQQPWFWMVMAPLIVVIIVSLGMASVAFYYADDVVSDNYYKEGRMLAQEFVADEYANSIGLAGDVVFDFASGEVILQLNQNVGLRELDLLISHPAKAAKDLRLVLKKISAKRYRADVVLLEGRWYLRLSATKEGQELWRLHGEIDFSHHQNVALK